MELGFRTHDMTALIIYSRHSKEVVLVSHPQFLESSDEHSPATVDLGSDFCGSQVKRHAGKELTTLRTSSGYGERCVEADARPATADTASPTDNALGESVVVFRMSEKLRLQKSHQSRSQQKRVSLHPPVVISHPIITVGGDLTEGVNSNPAKNTNGAVLQCPARAGNQ
jgi:hypothetical protein